MPEGIIILHLCTTNDNHDVWFLIYQARHTDFLVIPENKIFEKMKKAPGGFIIYTSVPKIIITGYTVLQIWCVPDVIVIFHFQLFFTLSPSFTALSIIPAVFLN